MERGEQARLRSSFGRVATLYAQHRPGLWNVFDDRVGWVVLAEQQREIILGRIGAFLSNHPATASGYFTLPMQTAVLRAKRR